MVITNNTNSNPMDYFGLRTIAFTRTSETGIPNATSEFFEDEDPVQDGCGQLPYLNPVLAESSFTDELNNDVSWFLYQLPLNTDTLGLTLQKWSGFAWVDQTTLTDNTYGTYFATGFFPDRDTFFGFALDWSLVLPSFGEGIYKIKAEGSFISGSYTSYTELFCLKEYSVASANDTVKFEWNLNRIFRLGNGKTLDVGDMNFAQSMRVHGYFGNRGSVEETEEIEYSNNQIDEVRKDLIRTHTFQSGQLPRWLHTRLEESAFLSNTEPEIISGTTDFRLSSNLRVTDYNTNNDEQTLYRRFAIRRAGEYRPNKITNSLLSRVTLECTDKVIRPQHRYC